MKPWFGVAGRKMGGSGLGASMASSKSWLVGLALMGAPAVAWAQAEAPKPAPSQPAPSQPASSQPGPAAKPAAPTPVPPTAAKGKTVEGITVTGGAPDTQTSIDRRSFTLGKDLQATTGSIADALRNIPSVEVDLQGNLSMRGDPNVTILVDGKPSPAFEGAGRADALQQLPADQIERVEVITNPSAALNPEGSGGVINLISKKSRGSGVTGSAYATAGSGGLKRVGVNLGYNSKKLAITSSLAGNYQRNKNTNRDLRGGFDPASGQFLNSVDQGFGRNIARGPTARVNLTYTASPRDQITGGASYNEQLIHGHPFDRVENDGVGGVPTSIFSRQGARRFLETDTSLTAGWKHSFAGEGHELSVDLIHNDSIPRDHTLYTTFPVLPPTPVPLEALRDDADQQHSELRLAYSQALAGGSLKTGYELKYDDNAFDHEDAMGPTEASLVRVPGLANHFRFKQTLNAAYATYQHAFGDFDAQAGLRVETVRTDLDQLTSGEKDRQDYAKAYPTLHLAYKLDDERKLSASYSQRVQRPPAFLLNPLRFAVGPTDVLQGNPNLKPQDTQSFELGYEQRKGAGSYQATVYYRRNANQFVGVLIDLGNGVFEQTFGNLGSSRAAGVELTANGKLSSTLTYNANGNFYWSETDAGNLGVGAGAQSAFGVSGRANLNWQVRRDDLMQFNLIANGKRLGAQGFNEPTYIMNLGWRHKLNDKITATLTAQDLLDGAKFQRRLATPRVLERLDVKPVSRALVFRLDYRFGGKAAKPARDPGFEYENGAAPPG
jgi:outer membrane receptor protein involved in Fe transport